MSKRSRMEIRVAGAALTNLLRKNGLVNDRLLKRREIVQRAEKILGIIPPEAGQSRSTWNCRLVDAYRIHAGLPPVKVIEKKKSVPADKVAAFYKSYDWRKVRVDALEKNDGRCELCGRSKHDGIVLHVDHIKPVRLHWKMRLDADNLQVLCNECNHGKGNRYSTDWREKSGESG